MSNLKIQYLNKNERTYTIEKDFKKIIPKDENNFMCPICLSNDTKSCILRTCCNHDFHKDCIMNNVVNINLCPMCRKNIINPGAYLILEINNSKRFIILVESFYVNKYNKIINGMINKQDLNKSLYDFIKSLELISRKEIISCFTTIKEKNIQKNILHVYYYHHLNGKNYNIYKE